MANALTIRSCAVTCAAIGLLNGTALRAAETETTPIEELVVTAHPLSGEGLAQPVSTLEGEALERAFAATLGETLVNQPGVHSATFGQAVGRPVIRGLSGPRVKIMEDRIDSLDVSVSSPDHATSVEPFIADRIEVLKGPSTLLYGNGAIGGVVDVHTGRIPHRKPERLAARAELRGADNADQRVAAGMLKGNIGGFVLHLDGFYRDADEYEIPGFAESRTLREPEGEEAEAFGTLPGSQLETSGGAAGLSFVGDSGFIGAAVSVYDAEYGLPGGHIHDEGEEEEEAGNPVLDLDQTRMDFEAGLQDPFGGADSLNVRIGWNDYRHTEIEPSGEPGTVFNNEALEGRIEVVHAPLYGFAGAGGLQLAAREYAAIGEEAYVPPVDTQSFGLFYVGQRAFEALELEAGLRYERVSHDPDFGLTRRFDLGAASLGLILPLESGWTIATQLDYSTRAPTVEELFSDGPHLATRSYEVGDPELDKERAAHLSATVQYEIDQLRVGISGYYTDFTDFIYEAPTGDELDGLPVFLWQQADATFRGVDMEAEWRAIRWDSGSLVLTGFYDIVRARLSQSDNRDLPRIPPQRYGLGARVYWHGLTAKLDYARTDDQDRTAGWELPTDGFDDLRAYLGYAFLMGDSRVELFVAGRNLTDDEQRFHTSFIKDFAPQPGRTLEGGIRVVL